MGTHHRVGRRPAVRVRLLMVVGLLLATWVAALADEATGPTPSLESPGIKLVSADPSLPHTGWTVTAGSQQPTQPATYAVDGNPATFWHSKYSAPAAPLPHVLTIDMHAQNLVTSVRYLPRTDLGVNGRIGRFKLEVSSDGASWGSAVASGTFGDDAVEKVVAVKPVVTRFVRLTALTEAGNRGPWTTAAEINIAGFPAPTLSRAGWTASADSAQAGASAAAVLDGSATTIWHSQYTPTLLPLPHWVTLDMHATAKVSGLRYLPRPAPAVNGRIGDYKVYASTDGTTWGDPVATGTFPDTAGEKVVTFRPVTARFIRLTAVTEAGHRGQWSSAAELNLLGTAAPTLPKTGWTATADSEHPGNAAAAVLDEDPLTFWHTEYTPAVAPLPHSLTIDMHTTTEVSGLRYLPRPAPGVNGRIGGYQVFVSTDGANWGTPVATGTFPDTATEKVVTFTAATARFVRLTALTEAGKRGQWTSAAELDLLGPQPDGDPAATGAWGATMTFPLVPVAAAMLYNGKVLVWSSYEPYTHSGGSLTYTAVWDPATGVITPRVVTNTDHDMFCPGLALLPDGRVLVNGGSDNRNTSIYGPDTDEWSVAQQMNIPRGYEGSVTMADGRVFTLGGSWSGPIGHKDGEIFSADSGWTPLPGALAAPMETDDPQGEYRSDNHPWLFAVPGDRVLQVGPSKHMNLFDASGSGSYTAVGDRGDDQDAMNGNAVMYDVGKILTVGGAPAYQYSTPDTDARVIEVGDVGDDVSVRKVSPMAYPRSFANSVVLPDGKVLVTGGQEYAIPFTDTQSVMHPELWDPETEKFTTMSAMTVPRNYHSVALLLPDGRVFTGGGGLCGACDTNHTDGQVFSPPYLFAADGSPAVRPVITTAPGSAEAGARIAVTTSDSVAGFSLVRLGSSTHSLDTDQRRVPLTPVSHTGTTYKLDLPADHGVLVPGYYMLFALDAHGVPSVSKAIRIT